LNDPDCLMARTTRTSLTRDEARSLAVAVGATGGMVLFSDDVPSLAPESRALVADTIGLAREVDDGVLRGAPRTLGLLDAEIGYGVAARTAGGRVLALFNTDDVPVTRSVDPISLGLDRWSAPPRALLGSEPPQIDEGGGLTMSLAPHASALLRIPEAARLGVFCDFDGTFAVQDVGSTLARRYAGDRRPAAWARFERGEITAWEYNLEILHGLAVPEEALEAFLQSVELDPGARALVGWCEAHGIPFRVLSDGFDRNLDRLQEIHGVRFAYDANRLRYAQGRWQIEAAHPDPSCECGTGTCKRARIEEFRRSNPAARVVHIGNGRVSDLCGALASDVAFAKGSLAEELAKRGAEFQPFETLLDVVAFLDRMLTAEAP
jgi:2,3-diketo-5-methylthio-1-phosphopentane phosphatase